MNLPRPRHRASLAAELAVPCGQRRDFIRSFAALGPDDFMETYERFEDEAIAADLAADCAAEFAPETLHG